MRLIQSILALAVLLAGSSMIASTASAQIGANPVATRACPSQFRGVAMYIEYIVKKQLNVPMVDIAYTADAFGTGPVLGSTGFLSAIIRTALGNPSLPVIQAGDIIQVLGPKGQTWFQGTMSATFVPHPV
jgi:hypothetical protein